VVYFGLVGKGLAGENGMGWDGRVMGVCIYSA